MAGTNVARRAVMSIQLSPESRSAIERAFSYALPECVINARSVVIAPAATRRRPNSSETLLEGWGIYLDLPNTGEKGYFANEIFPFVSVRIVITYADGMVRSQELAHFERIGIPNDVRLTVREVEESAPSDLAALVTPFIMRHASDWKKGDLASLCPLD